MKKFSFVILVLAMFFLVACNSETQQPQVVVNSAKPTSLIAEGRLLPINSMNQSFSIPGQVDEILVENGESVKAGQVLARLNGSPELQLALARAKQEALLAQQALDELDREAQMALTQGRLAVLSAKTQYDKAKERYNSENTDENKAALEAAKAVLDRAMDLQMRLEEGKGTDPILLEAAAARLATAQAALASAQSAFDALELKATIDGSVVDMTLQVGERVTAGQPVISLADFSSWVVKTDNLTEIEVIQLEAGQKVKIILDALPDAMLDGEITYINTRYEEKRGDITYTVTVALKQADPAMRWGMTAAVQFEPVSD